MPHELLYTSAPRGLDQGTCGFCTVQRSAGLDRVVQRQLESLSGLGVTAGATAFQNRAIVMHTSMIGPGGTCRVLSRISVGGEDYSGRANLVAHHLVIPVSECPACGPALLAATSGVLKSSWDGRVAQTPAVSFPGRAMQVPSGAPSWREAFGDSGWAGAVLFELSRQRSQPTWVIVPDGTDALRLIVELTMCLQPAERWSVSFATEYQPLPAGTQCLLRFVSQSSPLVAGIPQRGGSGIVDLTQRNSLPADAREFAAAVRAGRMVQLNPGAAAASIASASATRTATTDAASTGQSSGEMLFQLAQQEARGRSRSAELTAGQLSTPGLAPNTQRLPLEYHDAAGRVSPKASISSVSLFRTTGLLALSLATLAICGIGTGTFLYMKAERSRLAQKQKDDETERNRLAVSAARKSDLGKTRDAAKGKLQAILMKTTEFAKSPLRNIFAGQLTANDPEQHAGGHRLQVRLKTAIDSAASLSRELQTTQKDFDQARSELHAFSPLTNDELSELSDQFSEADHSLDDSDRILQTALTVTHDVNRSFHDQSREEVQEVMTRLEALKPLDAIRRLRSGLTVDDGGGKELDWMDRRIGDLAAFCQQTDSFRSVPVQMTPEGLQVSLHRPSTAKGPVTVSVHVPPRMQSLLNPSDILVRELTASATNQEGLSELLVALPDDQNARLCAAFLCLHESGELVDQYLVPQVDAQIWPAENLSAMVLCRLNSVKIEMLLRPQCDLTLTVQGGPDESGSPALTLTPGEPSAGQDDGESRILNRYALNFWRHTKLTPDGLVPESPELTPGRQLLAELGQLLKIRLPETLESITDQIKGREWVKPRTKLQDAKTAMKKLSANLMRQLELSFLNQQDIPHVQKLWSELDKQLTNIEEVCSDPGSGAGDHAAAASRDSENVDSSTPPAGLKETPGIPVEAIQSLETVLSEIRTLREVLNKPDWNMMESATAWTLTITEIRTDFAQPLKPRTIVLEKPLKLRVPFIAPVVPEVPGGMNTPAAASPNTRGNER